MTNLFDLPSHQFQRRLQKAGWDESKHPRDQRGRWAHTSGKGALLLSALATLASGKLVRYGTRRSDFIPARAMANDALDEVRRISGSKVRRHAKPGGVLERDILRHIRVAAAKDPNPSFLRGFKEAEDVLRQVTRRELVRSQGGVVRPLRPSKQ